MAGDWIKMRSSLQRDPRVIKIASALNADRLRVIGGLHAAWSLADEQTEDGFLDGYTFSVIDEMIGWGGFCAALKAVDWAQESDRGVALPRFEKHNGQSAKRRAQESDRKRSARSSAPEADKKRTREEKRRDKNKTAIPPNGGSTVWDFGRALLIEQGLSNQSAGALIGSWLRDWTEPDVAEALRLSAGKADVRSYVAAILKAKTRKGVVADLKVAMP